MGLSGTVYRHKADLGFRYGPAHALYCPGRSERRGKDSLRAHVFSFGNCRTLVRTTSEADYSHPPKLLIASAIVMRRCRWTRIVIVTSRAAGRLA